MRDRAPKKRPRFSEEMIRACLDTLEAGEIDELFEIIPRIGVLRDPRFSKHLLLFLRGRDLKRREFAAYAIGAIGNREFLEPLKKAYREAAGLQGPAAEDLQVAILDAIGSLGDDAAVEFFLPLLEEESERNRARHRRIVEAMGQIGQQGGEKALEGLMALTAHPDSEIRAQAVSELSVAYWHRPNDIPALRLNRIYELRNDASSAVAESAIAALESLADVGCIRAEKFFGPGGNR